jgi:hypothetical protein
LRKQCESRKPRGRARDNNLESVALEVASFGYGITIIEPGGARTEFHDGGARVAKLMPIYRHSLLRRLDPRNDWLLVTRNEGPPEE